MAMLGLCWSAITFLFSVGLACHSLDQHDRKTAAFAGLLAVINLGIFILILKGVV